MSKDLSPHIYRPLPSGHCRKCLGFERSDFCKRPLITHRPGTVPTWAPISNEVPR